MPSARNELKTLSAENAERVARHMAMAARAIDDDPQLAHEHAQAAMRHAGRVGVVRETLAITAYATGDFALALRELRTVRRITGRNDHIAMIVDSERGVGRPEKALEEGRAVDRESLPVGQRVELAIAMSGARLDLGQTELALAELDIPELDPDRAFPWSPGLFAARAAVLEDLGLASEAEEWRRRAEIAADALEVEFGSDDEIIVDEVEETEPETAHESRADAGETHDAEPPVDAEPPADAEPEQLDDADAPAESFAPIDDVEYESIEDEVAQILADAGIVDDESETTEPEADESEPGDDLVGESVDANVPDADATTASTRESNGNEEEDRPDGALF